MLFMSLNARDSSLDVVSPSVQPLRKDVAAVLSRMDSQQLQRRDIKQAEKDSLTREYYKMSDSSSGLELPETTYWGLN